MNYPVWAERAAYEWAAGRWQRHIALELGLPLPAVSRAISIFMMAVYPDLATDQEIYGGAACWIPASGEERRQLLRKHFGLPESEAIPRGPRPRRPQHKPPGGRIVDPDERFAARDVWLTYSLGPDGFAFMEPVRQE